MALLLAENTPVKYFHCKYSTTVEFEVPDMRMNFQESLMPVDGDEAARRKQFQDALEAAQRALIIIESAKF